MSVYADGSCSGCGAAPGQPCDQLCSTVNCEITNKMLRSRVAELEGERDRAWTSRDLTQNNWARDKEALAVVRRARDEANAHAAKTFELFQTTNKRARDMEAERDRYRAENTALLADKVAQFNSIVAERKTAESRLAAMTERAEFAEHYVQQRTDHEWVKAMEGVVEAARKIVDAGALLTTSSLYLIGDLRKALAALGQEAP